MNILDFVYLVIYLYSMNIFKNNICCILVHLKTYKYLWLEKEISEGYSYILKIFIL